MSRMLILMSGAIACAVALLAPRGLAIEVEATSNGPAAVEDFGEGIVAVIVERTAGLERYSNNVAMRNARLVKLGDRYFIRGIGHVAKANEDDKRFSWAKDLDLALAWDGVVEFYVYTPEQFESHMASIKENE